MNQAERLAELIPRLRRYARALLGDAIGADDLVELALEQAWPALHRSRQPDLRLWIFALMHRVYENRAEPAQAGVAPPQSCSDTERAILCVPPQERAVLLLVTLEDMTYQEVADTLGIPLAGVLARLAGAREKLRGLLLGDGQLKAFRQAQ